MKRFTLLLSRKQWFINHKTFLGHNLDYADIISGKPFKDCFKEKFWNSQCYAARTITGAIKGTCWERLYKEHGLLVIEGGSAN